MAAPLRLLKRDRSDRHRFRRHARREQAVLAERRVLSSEPCRNRSAIPALAAAHAAARVALYRAEVRIALGDDAADVAGSDLLAPTDDRRIVERVGSEWRRAKDPPQRRLEGLVVRELLPHEVARRHRARSEEHTS